MNIKIYFSLAEYFLKTNLNEKFFRFSFQIDLIMR